MVASLDNSIRLQTKLHKAKKENKARAVFRTLSNIQDEAFCDNS